MGFKPRKQATIRQIAKIEAFHQRQIERGMGPELAKATIRVEKATIRVLLPDYRNPPKMKAYITDDAYQELKKELSKNE